MIPEQTKQNFAKIIAEDFSEKFPIHPDKTIQGKLAKRSEETKAEIIEAELTAIIDGRLAKINTEYPWLAKIIAKYPDKRLAEIIAEIAQGKSIPKKKLAKKRLARKKRAAK